MWSVNETGSNETNSLSLHFNFICKSKLEKNCFRFRLSHKAKKKKKKKQPTEVYRRQDVEMVTVIHETVSFNCQAVHSLMAICIKSSHLLVTNVDLTAEDGASFYTPVCRLLEKEVRDCQKPAKGKPLPHLERKLYWSLSLLDFLWYSGVQAHCFFSCFFTPRFPFLSWGPT